MDVIDMHNHFIAPEVIDFLAREGKHFATRIVERDGRSFFLIQEKAMRPIDGPISNAQRAHRGHGSRRRHGAGGLVRAVPDVSGRRGRTRTRDRAGEQRRDGGSGSERRLLTSCRWRGPDAGSGGWRPKNSSALRSWGFAASRFRRRSSNVSSTSRISRSSGKRLRRCGWSFASIRSKPRRPERFRDTFSATWSAIFTTPGWLPRC